MKDTVARFEYPAHLALINRLLTPLRSLSGIGSVSPLDIAKTACKAERQPVVQTEDEMRARFGGDFETAVRLSTDWPLSAMGQIQWRAVLATAARMRLQLDAYLAAGRPLGTLQRPLFIVGLPRTGTTLLQSLLASDAERAGLHFWELLRPIPNPQRRFDRQLRLFNGMFAAWLYRFVAPEYPTLHLTTARTLEECWYLFMPSYAVLNADFPMPSPGYGDWILARDMLPAYERYRTLLRILQLEVGPRRLVLKCPDHLWFLDSIFRVFPDADVIWTHRDPAKALPSYAAQMALPGRQYMGRIDPRAIGERLTLRFRQGLERAEGARARYPDASIVDVLYADLAARPLATTCSALRQLGQEPSAEHIAAMERFLATQAERGRSTHHYRAETYGLEASALHETFAAYLERFRIPLET